MTAAEKLNTDTAALRAGHVERCEGSTIVVRSEGALVRARRAPSCIVAPEVGDRVLCAHTGEGRSYVLAVLERDEELPARWSADGDVTIEASGQLALASRALAVKSEVARFALSRVRLLGREVLAEVDRTKLVGRTIESVSEVLQQTAARVARVVTDIEHVRAGTIDVATQKSFMVHAENAMVTAKALVKMDGEAVQLG
jgi:hypothetical protein